MLLLNLLIQKLWKVVFYIGRGSVAAIFCVLFGPASQLVDFF